MKEFVLNNWYYILYCVVWLIIASIIIVKYIKTKKNAKTTKEIAEAREKFKLEINELIKQAETLVHYKGTEKKEFVITRAISLGNGLMSLAEIDAYIEEQVALTDKVNKHNH